MVFLLALACRTPSSEDTSIEIEIRPEDEQTDEQTVDDTGTPLQDIDQDGFLEDVDCDDWNPNVLSRCGRTSQRRRR